jgi:hypothetical protein
LFAQEEARTTPRDRFPEWTSRGPLDRDLVTAHGADIKSPFQRVGQDQFAATLAHLAERLERTGRFDTEFLCEFPARCGLRVFAVVQLPFRNRPCAEIAVAPKRAAGMDEENDKARVAMTIHQDAGAYGCHLTVAMLSVRNEGMIGPN